MHDTNELAIFTFLRAAGRRWYVVLACLLVLPAVTYVLNVTRPKVYTATAQLLFREDNYDKAVLGGAYVEPYKDPAREGATNLELASLPVVSRRVAERFPDLTVKQVDTAKKVSAVGDADVAAVSFTRRDREEAAALANAYAAEYVEYRREAAQSQVRRSLRLVQQNLASLTPTERGEGEGDELRRQARRLELLAALQTGNAQIAQTAAVPGIPSGPRILRNTAMGAVLGLLLGLLLAYLLDRLDRRVRTPNEVSELTELPVLAAIAQSRALARANGDARGVPGGLEPFRMLRANLRYFDVDRDIKSVVVTSASPGDGKSIAAWNLALAAAQGGGLSVLLIEADLRNPGLTKIAQPGPTPGLGAVVAGHAEFDEARREIPTGGADVDGGPTMDVLFAGPPPPNPSELIDSQAMRELLTMAGERYDLVVVDTPPASVVSDAVPLVRQVSGVVVVTRLGKNTRDGLLSIVKMLRQLGAPILGVVVNGVEEATPYYGSGGPSTPDRDGGAVAVPR